MIDAEALKAAIVDSGIPCSTIAGKMGITRESLFNKLEGRTEFKLSEIEGITKILHMSVGQRNQIFFAK